MTNVIFKVTSLLASLLGQVYETETKIAVETPKIEMLNPISDTVHSKTIFHIIPSNTKKQQPS